MNFQRKQILGLLLVGVAQSLCGCLGPLGVHQVRSQYNDAIRTTNDEELLLNLVRLRYKESPSFLPVTGLTSQFEMDVGATGRGGVDRGGASNYGEGTLSFADRPTITFTPQRSPELTKALLSHISLETLYLFGTTGYDVDVLLRLFVRNVNGLESANGGHGSAPHDPADVSEFLAAAELMTHLQHQRLVVLALENRPNDVPDAPPFQTLSAQDLVRIKEAGFGVRVLGENKGFVLTKTVPVRTVRVAPAALGSAEVLEWERLMRLKPGLESYELEDAPEGQLKSIEPAGLRTKITITTRSVLEVMHLMSQAVALPEPQDCQDATPVAQETIGELLRIHSQCSRRRPKSAAVAVNYRGSWFYIDDSEQESKKTLALFNELFRLQRIGAAEGQPVLTLPVGR
jgi:hypothetical protein